MRITSAVPGGVDTSMVDRIMDAESAPMEAIKERKGRTVLQKNEYTSLNGILGDLGTAASGLQLVLSKHLAANWPGAVA